MPAGECQTLVQHLLEKVYVSDPGDLLYFGDGICTTATLSKDIECHAPPFANLCFTRMQIKLEAPLWSRPNPSTWRSGGDSGEHGPKTAVLFSKRPHQLVPSFTHSGPRYPIKRQVMACFSLQWSTTLINADVCRPT